MRSLILFACFCCSLSSSARSNATKEETVKLLREKLTHERSVRDEKQAQNYVTKMCVDYNLHSTGSAKLEAKNFRTKIESFVSWTPNALEIQNDIYEHGKLKETYTYDIPLTAIADVGVTNCQRNPSKNVNAYFDRPICITVKKNTTRIGHVRFDKDGKAINSKAGQYHMNSTDGDWESVIPIAGKWDRNETLLKQLLSAFTTLAEFNK